jgi:hypothetical protein
MAGRPPDTRFANADSIYVSQQPATTLRGDLKTNTFPIYTNRRTRCKQHSMWFSGV